MKIIYLNCGVYSPQLSSINEIYKLPFKLVDHQMKSNFLVAFQA